MASDAVGAGERLASAYVRLPVAVVCMEGAASGEDVCALTLLW